MTCLAAGVDRGHRLGWSQRAFARWVHLISTACVVPMELRETALLSPPSLWVGFLFLQIPRVFARDLWGKGDGRCREVSATFFPSPESRLGRQGQGPPSCWRTAGSYHRTRGRVPRRVARAQRPTDGSGEWPHRSTPPPRTLPSGSARWSRGSCRRGSASLARGLRSRDTPSCCCSRRSSPSSPFRLRRGSCDSTGAESPLPSPHCTLPVPPSPSSRRGTRRARRP